VSSCAAACIDSRCADFCIRLHGDQCLCPCVCALSQQVKVLLRAVPIQQRARYNETRYCMVMSNAGLRPESYDAFIRHKII
jgi:hypothetical protein